MLAPAHLPDRYVEWNKRHGAPSGHPIPQLRWKRLLLSEESILRRRGPFAIQSNNTTRQFEYPWAFEVADLTPGMRVAEIGGGFCGFQFVLDRFGCKTINIDPGLAAKGLGWHCDDNSMRKLNGWFDTHVQLHNTTIDNASLSDNSLDRVFSISVIEHLPKEEAHDVMQHAHRCLKPGGLFVLTADLFLNLEPFCSRKSNQYGTNQDLRSLLQTQTWEMTHGLPAELLGFEQFKTDAILSNLDSYLIGNYPTLVQCVVLRKST